MTNRGAMEQFCLLMGGKIKRKECEFWPTNEYGDQRNGDRATLTVEPDMMWLWTGNSVDVHGFRLKDEARAFRTDSRVGIEFMAEDGRKFDLICGLPGEKTDMVCRLHDGVSGGDDQLGDRGYLEEWER